MRPMTDTPKNPPSKAPQAPPSGPSEDSEQGAWNRLAGSPSPYLEQHAGNPVDWYPWGPEALALARETGRPILLSIGYAACHWCHVMARESFADTATAALMNAHFVNIKVDREERPDLDKVYQAALSILTRQNGGWPLTIFLDPNDQVPFFGGTYFPAEARSGMPAFRDILLRVANAWQARASDISSQNAEVKSALLGLDDLPPADDTTLRIKPLHDSRKFLESIHDKEHGGFGSAPKFPQAASLQRLIRHWAHMRDIKIRDDRALKMVRRTLEHICDGGIFDHVGGGFARYAVDDAWMIPHFEKMLVDNGMLLSLLADGWLMSDKQKFRDRAAATVTWMMREMQLPDGTFAASLNADSEDEEGTFYVFTRDELAAAVAPADWTLFAAYFGVDGGPNFEGRHHLYVAQSLNDACQATGVALGDAQGAIDRALAALFAYRSTRVHPSRDEKTLTAWNAQAIRGLAHAGRVFGETTWLDLAEQCLESLRAIMWDGMQLAGSARDGKATGPGFLDDYVMLIDALLRLLEARWNTDDLEFATTLADCVLAKFEDPQGGFYFTPHEHESLVARMKGMHDDALPGGNGVAARVLIELGELTGNPRYLDAAERTLQRAWPVITQAPAAHNALLDALALNLALSRTAVIRGSKQAIASWQSATNAHLAPHIRVFAIPDDAPRLPEGLAERAAVPRRVVGYLCEGVLCQAPINDFDLFIAALKYDDGQVIPET